MATDKQTKAMLNTAKHAKLAIKLSIDESAIAWPGGLAKAKAAATKIVADETSTQTPDEQLPAQREHG